MSNTILTIRQQLLLRKLSDGPKTGRELYDDEVKEYMTSRTMEDLMNGFVQSGHVTKSWPNKYSIKDKGRKAITPIR